MSKQSEAVKRWRIRTKQKLIFAMGGKCAICGYDRCDEALEFHHVDPTEKEISWGQLRANIKGFQQIVEEMKKCVLLCSNCHKEVHSKNSTTKVPNNYPQLDVLLLKLDSVNDVDDKFVDGCPGCGEKKLIWQTACSAKCANHKRKNKYNLDNYDIVGMCRVDSISGVAKIIGCTQQTISRYLRKNHSDIFEQIKAEYREINKNKQKQRIVDTLNKKSSTKGRNCSSITEISPREILKDYQDLSSFEAVGRKYNVTGAAIKRKIKHLL